MLSEERMTSEGKEPWWSGWIETLGLVAFIAFMALMINSKDLWELATASFSAL